MQNKSHTLRMAKVKLSTLNTVILWNHILSGFILIVLFQHKPDENRGLNQAMTSVAGCAIGLLLASAFLFIGIWTSSLIGKTTETHFSIYASGIILMLFGLVCFIALVCMQVIDVLARYNPGATGSTVIFIFLCVSISCSVAFLLFLYAAVVRFKCRK